MSSGETKKNKNVINKSEQQAGQSSNSISLLQIPGLSPWASKCLDAHDKVIELLDRQEAEKHTPGFDEDNPTQEYKVISEKLKAATNDDSELSSLIRPVAEIVLRKCILSDPQVAEMLECLHASKMILMESKEEVTNCNDLENKLNICVQTKQEQYGYKSFDVTNLYQEYLKDRSKLQNSHAATTESTDSFLNSSEWNNVYKFRVVYILRIVMRIKEKTFLRQSGYRHLPLVTKTVK